MYKKIFVICRASVGIELRREAFKKLKVSFPDAKIYMPLVKDSDTVRTPDLLLAMTDNNVVQDMDHLSGAVPDIIATNFNAGVDTFHYRYNAGFLDSYTGLTSNAEKKIFTDKTSCNNLAYLSYYYGLFKARNARELAAVEEKRAIAAENAKVPAHLRAANRMAENSIHGITGTTNLCSEVFQPRMNLREPVGVRDSAELKKLQEQRSQTMEAIASARRFAEKSIEGIRPAVFIPDPKYTSKIESEMAVKKALLAGFEMHAAILEGKTVGNPVNDSILSIRIYDNTIIDLDKNLMLLF